MSQGGPVIEGGWVAGQIGGEGTNGLPWRFLGFLDVFVVRNPIIARAPGFEHGMAPWVDLGFAIIPALVDPEETRRRPFCAGSPVRSCTCAAGW